MKEKILSLLLILSFILPFIPIESLAINSNEPELLSLTVTDSTGKAVSLLDGEKSIHLGKTYSFVATFSHAEVIDKVYITSTKGGEVKLLEASKDGNSFTTNGAFDGDSKYIPGKIGVEYTKKTNATSVEDTIDWDPMQDALKNQSSVTINSSSGETVQATVDISKLLNAGTDVAVDFAIDVFDATTDSDLAGFLDQYEDLEKLTEYVLDGGNYFAYLDYSKPSTYAMIVKNASGNKYVKMILDKSDSEKLSELANKLGDISKVSSLVNNYLNVSESADELREEIAKRSSISDEEKNKLKQKIDAYEKDRQLFDLSMAIIPAVVAASGGTMTGPVIVFNALLGTINAASGFFWEYRIGMITGCEPIDVSFTSDSHGIPLSHELLQKINYTITENGDYYLTENLTREINIGEPDGSFVDISLCAHGHGYHLKNNGGAIRLVDCVYQDAIENNETVETGYANIVNDGGYVTIESGKGNIRSDNEGHVTINGGEVSIEATNGGEIAVHGGTVGRIFNDDGSITIDNGIVKRIKNESGAVDIGGGKVEGINTVALQNEGGIVTIGGGTVIGSEYEAIRNEKDGTIYITGGEIHGSSRGLFNRGTIVIRDGSLEGYTENQGGQIEIFDGKILNSILNHNTIVDSIPVEGKVIIHDGLFQSEDRNIYNYSGIVTIDNGTFIAGEDNIDCDGRLGEITKVIINNGNFYSKEGKCLDNNAVGSAFGSMIVNGGTFCSIKDNCIDNSGIMTINGGAFSQDSPTDSLHGCVYNRGQGELVINDGAFYKTNGFACVYTENNDLTISNGQFIGPEIMTGIEGKGCTLLIGSASRIEVNSRFGAFRKGTFDDEISIIVKAKEGYTGGITHYNSINSAGTQMSITNAANLDFSSCYFCIEADGLPSCEHIWGEWKTIRNETCGTTGQRIRTCSKCNRTEMQIIPATGEHIPDGNTDNTKDTKCIICGAIIKAGSGSNSSNNSGSNNRGSSSNTSTVTITNGSNSAKVDIKVSEGTATINKFDKIDALLGSGIISFDLTTSKKNIDTVRVDSTIMDSIAYNEDIEGLEIKLSDGTVTLDSGTVAAVKGSDLTVKLDKTNALNSKQKDAVKDMDVHANYELTVNGTKALKDGKVDVRIPFTIPSDKDADGFGLYFVAEDGTAEEVSARFSGSEVHFTADAFGDYVIAYKAAEPMESVDNKHGAADCDGGSGCPAHRFSDVNTGLWYHKALDYAINNDLMSGVGENTFSPNANLSRAMLAQILYNLAGKPAVTENSDFNDVAAGMWYTNAIAWAAEEGVVSGLGDGKFGPNNNITREQLAVMLYHYAGSPEAAGSLDGFADAGKASDYAQNALTWATSNGVMNGKGGGMLDSQGLATRAEVAQMLYNYLNR